MYEKEQELEKKYSEESKSTTNAVGQHQNPVYQSLFGGNVLLQHSEANQSGSNSPTCFNTSLYHLLVKIFKNCEDCHPQLRKVFTPDIIVFILQNTKEYHEEKSHMAVDSEQETKVPQPKNQYQFKQTEISGIPSTHIRKTNIKKVGDDEYVFTGFHGIFGANMQNPDMKAQSQSRDILRQVVIVMNLWSQKKKFPINYEYLYMGSNVKDETFSYIEHISDTMTHLVCEIFENIGVMDHESATKNILHFLMNVGFRGFLTMLGFRKTIGSQEIVFPSPVELLNNFNRPNQLLSVEEMQRIKNISKLTVGARALCKHAHRSSDGFWGNPSGTEPIKNAHANRLALQILRECVWVNVHKMLQSEVIIECRVIQGYGIRWSGDGSFRGFLEPQMDHGHENKWKH